MARQPAKRTAPDASSRLLAEAGIDPGRPIALYCGGDVPAAEAFEALRTAGVQTARVYDDS
jgi:3-mercaptopyruvate sulfurtransferase SseA